ncbi:MAG: hypothetical protein A2152_00340 [Candidatus Levybacteria bacterium RBG_16_35_6]|nr:MAG: hypothetical protein A2152_00340 [Candidatus Levybacteria bacterium RBG_16_35_6]
MVNPKTYFLKFSHRKKEASNVYSFFFEKDSNKIIFEPGQYMKVFLEIKNPDNRGSSRYFTISENPLDQKYISITTKVIRSSFKKTLMKLKKGGKVKFFGPIGTFLLNERRNKEKVFLAGGIGITPFHSTIKYFYEKKKHPKITLLASFSEKNSFVFMDELLEIAKKDPGIIVVYKIGRIDKKFILDNVLSLNNKEFYVVGPAKMVEDIFKVLKSMSVPDKNIFKEDFTGY